MYIPVKKNTAILDSTYAAYPAGILCVCVFNETVVNRLCTIKWMVTMNTELEIEWVTGIICLTGEVRKPDQL
jgi:hypothetical protein